MAALLADLKLRMRALGCSVCSKSGGLLRSWRITNRNRRALTDDIDDFHSSPLEPFTARPSQRRVGGEEALGEG